MVRLQMGIDIFSPSNATTRPYTFRSPPYSYSRSVTDFRGWGAHRAQLRCPMM
jgi:hypothetical protein